MFDGNFCFVISFVYKSDPAPVLVGGRAVLGVLQNGGWLNNCNRILLNPSP